MYFHTSSSLCVQCLQVFRCKLSSPNITDALEIRNPNLHFRFRLGNVTGASSSKPLSKRRSVMPNNRKSCAAIAIQTCTSWLAVIIMRIFVIPGDLWTWSIFVVTSMKMPSHTTFPFVHCHRAVVAVWWPTDRLECRMSEQFPPTVAPSLIMIAWFKHSTERMIYWSSYSVFRNLLCTSHREDEDEIHRKGTSTAHERSFPFGTHCPELRPVRHFEA